MALNRTMSEIAVCRDLADAVTSDEWQAASEIAENVTEWMPNGGFPTSITGKTAVDRIVVRSTIEAIATWEVV